MNSLAEYASCEIEVKNSKFLAEIFPIKTQAEARTLLKTQKQKYKDASHVVHAFVLGETAGILGCSDDGEPAGTAGKPILAVLRGKNITGVMLTVMRRFGGILLGTGGLVKAYSEAAKAVLEKSKIIPYIPKNKFELFCSYSEYEILKRSFADFSVETEDIIFGEKIKIKGIVPSDKKNALTAFIENAVKGSKSAGLIFP
ncbi:IMPACT family protein [Treponema pedis]|uniref:YigZ family protein n=1 Tax=Treponema pedis TaxID=409322 RepID=A0A7S6WMJ3_9SPIR|nr:YigZ family protein [Treponema pedis]QOW59939.1 YigZ family protein [Treponema pedis]